MSAPGRPKRELLPPGGTARSAKGAHPMSAHAGFDAARRTLGALAVTLALATGGIGPARGGGPLYVVNQQPVVHPNGGASVVLNLDRGPFGPRTNAQAVTLAQDAIALWNGVGTSTARLAIGTQLAADYTSANYTGVLGSFFDGLNPILFDTDGSIIDAIFGAGARNYVLGYAGAAYADTGAAAGNYLEGEAVLNGFLDVAEATWTVAFAHELGHFIGLDHSQLDGSQDLAPSGYALMYPYAYRLLPSLHDDDVATVSSIYPAANVASVYGQLAGTFTTAAGTPIRGANVWAAETTTGKVYSVVSDFLTQGTGHFRLYLPSGTYHLHAESIDPWFTGGSSVGPYANTPTDVSFQPPHPITPVALGAASPVAIPITPGCVATITFRLDGAGSATGDCGLPSYLLTVARTGAGTVTSTPAGVACGSDCSESYVNGTAVELAAAPAPGSAFTGWAGACSGSAPTCAVAMDAAKTVTAMFTVSSGNATLDVDASLTATRYDALTDGLLIRRHLSGVTGASLTTGALGATATRTDPAAIAAYLDAIRPSLDIDGDGTVDALTDGLLIQRYLFGLRGNALIAGAVGSLATRTTAVAIEAHVQSLLP